MPLSLSDSSSGDHSDDHIKHFVKKHTAKTPSSDHCVEFFASSTDYWKLEGRTACPPRGAGRGGGVGGPEVAAGGQPGAVLRANVLPQVRWQVVSRL